MGLSSSRGALVASKIGVDVKTGAVGCERAVEAAGREIGRVEVMGAGDKRVGMRYRPSKRSGVSRVGESTVALYLLATEHPTDLSAFST